MRPKVDRSGICGQDHQHEKAVCSRWVSSLCWLVIFIFILMFYYLLILFYFVLFIYFYLSSTPIFFWQLSVLFVFRTLAPFFCVYIILARARIVCSSFFFWSISLSLSLLYQSLHKKNVGGGGRRALGSHWPMANSFPQNQNKTTNLGHPIASLAGCT